MSAHPAAAIFPLMDGMELAALVEDIRTHGLLEPVVVHEGLILDGRNRARACELAGTQLTTVDWESEGMSPTEWVVSKNLHRRHLTVAQRAALALDLLPRLEAEAHERMVAGNPPPKSEEGGEAAEKAAELVGIGRTAVASAKAIQKRDESGETIDRMRSGDLNISQAQRSVGLVTTASTSAVATNLDTLGRQQPQTYFGKGDKFNEAIEPLRRYLKGWASRDYAFAHVTPKEARRRLAVLEELAAGLESVQHDLAGRSETARLSH